MAHLTFIEDKDGDVVDQEVYCSDYCARTSKLYNGWNGCAEITTSEPCAKCGEMVTGLDEYWHLVSRGALDCLDLGPKQEGGTSAARR